MPTYTGTMGIDNFTATTNEDWTIIGKSGNDVLNGAGGNDSIYGGLNNDVLGGAAGDDRFYIETLSGIDTFDGGSGYDRIIATADKVAVGIASMVRVEEISGGGYADVTLNVGSIDFTKVNLLGISMIKGGAMADRIVGSNGNDVINGGGGNDILSGGLGDDTFAVGVGGGFDRFNGGAGYNMVSAIGDNVAIGIVAFSNVQEISAGGFSNVSIMGQSISDNLDFSDVTLTDIVAINGGLGDDTIRGSIGDDFIFGGGGNDRLYGGEGNDTIDGGGGQNYLNGGNGDDIFMVTSTVLSDLGLNTFVGGAGYDMISGGVDNAVILLTTGSLAGIEEINSGGFGNVTIAGTVGVDVIDLHAVLINEGDIAAINGQDGDDTITGTVGADTIFGGTGDDTLKSGGGDDIVDGGAGFDYIDGGAGMDTVNGGAGDDVIFASGTDFLFGDDGDDIFLVGGLSGFNDYDGGTGFDTIRANGNATIGINSITGVELIDGNGFANVNLATSPDGGTLDFTTVQLNGIKSLMGGIGDDTITGSAGDDVMTGGKGDDTLNGGAGADTLTGGLGFDTLGGGNGADLFKDTTINIAGDRLTDFDAADMIQLTNMKFTGKAVLSWDGDAHLLTIDPDGAGLAKAFSISLDGGYDAAHFHLATDGANGTLISYDGLHIL